MTRETPTPKHRKPRAADPERGRGATPSAIRRRTLLHMGAAGIVGSALGACGSLAQESAATSGRSAGDSSTRKVLLVFFSRAGENYFNGGRKHLTVGNTELAADMIRAALQCDVYQIRPVEPYSDSYDDTVRRNVLEQDRNARPEMVEPLVSIDSYDTILLGSPVWNVQVPRIMLSFAERFDFTGKTVHPFVTYAVSGLGRVVENYQASCHGASFGQALAVRGEDVESSRARIETWLREIGQLG